MSLITQDEIKDGAKTAGEVLEVVSKGAGLIKDAVEWSGEAADKAADVKRVKAVMKFIKDEQNVLVEYTGDLLSESITSLSLGANNITSVLEDVHYLAKTVKSHTKDAKDYLEMMDEDGIKDDPET